MHTRTYSISINTGCSMQGRWGEEGYTKKWHVCWGGGNVKKCTSKSVFQPSETIMWNLSKTCVLCQNVFHALWNIFGKFSVKVGGKIMWGWPTSPFLMLITACTCLNYSVCGYLLVSNHTVINSGPPGSAKLSLFISDFNMVFFTGGRKF